jgi:hypothetical protein
LVNKEIEMNFLDDNIEYDSIVLEFDEFEDEDFDVPFLCGSLQEAVNEYRSMAN